VNERLVHIEENDHRLRYRAHLFPLRRRCCVRQPL
jgi:hypothetical protein